MEKLIYDTLVTTAQKGSLIKVLGGSYKSMWKCHGQKKYSQARRSR